MKKTSLLISLLLFLVMQQAQSQWIRTAMSDTEKVRALAMDGATLYAGTWNGVFRSYDGGASWAHLKKGPVFSLAFTASDLYAGGMNFLYYTPKSSPTWITLDYPDTAGRLYSVAARNDTFFVGTELLGLFRVWRKTPTWWISVQLGFQSTPVNCLVFDGATLYAGTGMGVYCSADAGENWTALNKGLTTLDTRALAFKGADLFAGTWGGGVFRSTDHGANWTPVSSGLTNKQVLSFAVTNHGLFAGTWEGKGGVFLSTNNGSSWTGVSEENALDPWFHIPGCVHGLAFDATYLYAGERTTGVWKRPLSEMVTSAESHSSDMPHAFALQQNYPNPFNPSTTIKYELPKSSEVRLSVFDMLGREVSVLVNERRDAGVHEVKFDGSNLASGVYFYRLQAGDFVQTRKVLVLR